MSNPQTQPKPTLQKEESLIDINLEDPGVAKAAVLLQAGFRGLKTRQQMNAKVLSTDNKPLISLHMIRTYKCIKTK